MQSCLESIPDDIRRVFVAYSGGLDSSVLLHLLLSSEREYEVRPWHINHGLVENASQMEQFCIQQAQAYGLEIRVDRLDLTNVDSNIEAVARQQRYRLFEENTQAGDCILTAHHADDQAETFLMNALRGSGVAGLRGIARQRRLGSTLLLRPLLEFSREQLEDYANRHELAWFNDPSNQNPRFDRNYLRREIIPLIRQRWPGYQDALATSSEIQSETQALLDEIGSQDYQDLHIPDPGKTDRLDINGMLQLSLPRRKNLVRYWITQAGLPNPPFTRLSRWPSSFCSFRRRNFSVNDWFLSSTPSRPNISLRLSRKFSCGISISSRWPKSNAPLHLSRARSSTRKSCRSYIRSE